MLLTASSRPIVTSLLPLRSKTALSDSTTSLSGVAAAGAAGAAGMGAGAGGGATGAAAGAETCAPASSRSPHSSQNIEPSGFSWPCEQRTVIVLSSLTDL